VCRGSWWLLLLHYLHVIIVQACVSIESPWNRKCTEAIWRHIHADPCRYCRWLISAVVTVRIASCRVSLHRWRITCLGI
jgi:hypothetical protein